MKSLSLVGFSHAALWDCKDKEELMERKSKSPEPQKFREQKQT